MPKVLSVIGVRPVRIGGAETLARELSLQLGEAGWESVLCFRSIPKGAVREYLEPPNVTFDTLEEPAGYGWRTCLDLLRVMRKHRCDVVHFYFTASAGPFFWLARLCSAKRILYTDEGSAPEGYIAVPVSGLKLWLGRFFTGPLTRFLGASDYNRRRAETLGYIPASRCETLYNAVDVSRVPVGPQAGFSFRERHDVPRDRAIVLQVGVLSPEKGIPDLLEAARRVLAVNEKVQFVVAGTGPLLATYRQEALKLGLGDHVTWTGMIEDPFAEGVFSAADVVCQLSRWEEAFGWTIAEAMAHRKPLVATRAGGIPELVEDGVSGFLIPVRDVDAAADRILQLLADPPLRQRFGEAARRKVDADFDVRKYTRRLLECYGAARAERSVPEMAKAASR